MTYAIIEIGGRQIYIQPGKFYDVSKLQASPGETILLNKVLFLSRNGDIVFGQPCIDTCFVKAKVLRHLKGKKNIAFKMKSKKNTSSKIGFRQHLTRLLIQEI